jgi:hypothetical protein
MSDDNDLDRWADNGGGAAMSNIVELPKVKSDDEVMAEDMGRLAKHYRQIYNACRDVGFSDEQAFALLRDFTSNMTFDGEEF